MNSGSHKRVLRELLSGGAAQISAAMVGFAVFPVLTWLLDESELGAWSLITTVAMMLGLANLGLEMAVQRAVVAKSPEMARRSLGFSLLCLSILGPILATVLVTTQLDFQGLDAAIQHDAWFATAIALAAGACTAIVLPYQAFVHANGGYNFIAAARASASLIQIITLTGFVMWRSLMVPATAMLLATMTELIITVRAARHFDPKIPIGPRLPKNRSEAFQLVRDGLAQVSINFAVVTADRVDLFVLKWITESKGRKQGLSSRLANAKALSALGQYYIAANVVGKAYKLAKQANTVLIRRLGNPEERVAALSLGTAVFSGVIVAGMFATAFDAQPFLEMVLGSKAATETVAIVLILLGGAHMLMSTYEIASSTVMLGSRTAWNCALPIVTGSIINLTISIAGGPTFGVWAVAGSTLVGNAVITLSMWWTAKNLLGLSLGRTLIMLVPALASATVAGSLAGALRSIAFQGGVQSLAVCVVVAISGVLAMAVVARSLQRRGLWQH